MMVCTTLYAANEKNTQLIGQLKNPYADKKQLDRILAQAIAQERTRQEKQRKKVAEILAQAKAFHLHGQELKKNEELDLLFDSFNSCYHLPCRSGDGQKLAIQQGS